MDSFDILDKLKLDPDKRIFSIVGAGGKTSTMYALARAFNDRGIKCILTTTTHILRPSLNGTFEPDLATIKSLLVTNDSVYCGAYDRMYAGNVKLRSFALTFLSRLAALCLANDIALLIEADGARRLPIKAPGENEPVIIDETQVLISIQGYDGVGKKIRDTAFRPEAVSSMLNKSLDDVLLPSDLSILLESPLGGKKGLKKGMIYVPVIRRD